MTTQSVLPTLIFLAAYQFLFAQSIDVEVTYVINDDRSVEFSYSKNVPGTITLDFVFKKLTNANYVKRPHYLNGYNGRLFLLRPSDPDKGIGFSYSYKFIRGRLKPKVNNEVVYALPFREQETIKVEELSEIGHTFMGKMLPRNWTAYQFKAQQSDTVFASRRGLVVEVVEGFEIDTTSHFQRNRNQIIVEHNDGSLARYLGFAKNGIFPKVGDKIEVESALGTLRDGETKGALQFMVYFLVGFAYEKEEAANEFITPVFATNTGNTVLTPGKTYSISRPQELILQEMSKRERKKYFQARK